MRSALAAVVALAVLPAAVGCGAPSGPSTSGRGTVTVFAAASLIEAFTALGAAFEEESGTTVRFSFGPSSQLPDQLAEGAPADVLATADEPTMEAALDVSAGPGRPVVFARNELTIGVPAGNPGEVAGLADLADEALVVGLCAAEVPCGALARRAFRSAGVHASIDTDEPDVKALVAKLASGEVDAGLVYRTDVLAADSGLDGIELPAAHRVATRYPIAAVTDAPAADAFVAFVRSPDGQAILSRHGFGPP